MSSLLLTAQPVKPLIKFVEGTTVPFLWGTQDAASGLNCVPEMVFIRFDDQRDYAAGWASVAGETETTRFFTEKAAV